MILPICQRIVRRHFVIISDMNLNKKGFILNTAMDKTLHTIYTFPSKMAYFKRVWWKVNVLSHTWPVGSTLPLVKPLKRGTLSLWTPSQASRQSRKNEKNVRFSTKTNIFFDHSTLTSCIFGTTGSSETSCTSFERSPQWYSGSNSSRAWQYIYPPPNPFEKGHFRGKKGKSYVEFCP